MKEDIFKFMEENIPEFMKEKTLAFITYDILSECRVKKLSTQNRTVHGPLKVAFLISLSKNNSLLSRFWDEGQITTKTLHT